MFLFLIIKMPIEKIRVLMSDVLEKVRVMF